MVGAAIAIAIWFAVACLVGMIVGAVLKCCLK
jgi:hypothetical protein